MRSLVEALSSFVRKHPVIVIVLSVVVSFALGAFGADFNNQGDGGNEAFAPDTPELLAAERIGELFGDESGQVPIQFLVQSDSGDVLTMDGLAAMNALNASLRSGAIAGDLIAETQEQPAFTSYLFPALVAAQQSGTQPTSDEEVKGLFAGGLEALPPDQTFFIDFLFPMDADPKAGPVDKALAIAFVNSVDVEQFDEYISRLSTLVDELEALELPDGYSVAPFSQELLFTTQDEFQGEITRLFGTAFLIIIVVLILVFWVGGVGRGLRRTLADVGVTMFTIILAQQWVWGFWKLFYDEPNPMSQIIPILLIGLGVDYSIHLTVRYREEIANGETVDAAIGLAIRTVGISLVLATVTTAVGFLTNITNDIKALQSFGVLAAVGIIAAFLLMLTFVPAVRTLLDRRAEAKGTLDRQSMEGGEGRLLPRVVGTSSVLAERIPVATLIVALVLGAVGAFGVTKLSTSFSFLDFVPTTSPIRDTAETLLDEFFVVGETTQVLVEGDIASATGWNAMAGAYLASGELPEVVTTPHGFPISNSPLAIIGQVANPQSPNFVPELGQLAQQVGLGQDLTISGESVAPLLDALFQAMPEVVGGVVHQADGGGYDAALIDFTTSGGEAGAGALQTGLVDAFSGVESAGLSAIPTSNNIISDVIITSLRDSQVSSLAITLVVATLLLILSFGMETRRPMLGLITALPVILVVMWSLAIMAALGIPFGPVTATISALAIGIGIPYTIHITRRYLEDQKLYATPEEAIRSTITHTGGALAGSAVTTVFGFGILVTSSTVPFQQFGLVTAYTILLSLIGAVLVLPSMLVLWDAYHRRKLVS